MAVDWTQPQPSYEELHAQLDALATARNAAVAEAALWQRRLITMQQERDQARANARACDKSHIEWEAAYDDLLRDFRRMEVQYHSALQSLDFANAAVRFTEATAGL